MMLQTFDLHYAVFLESISVLTYINCSIKRDVKTLPQLLRIHSIDLSYYYLQLYLYKMISKIHENEPYKFILQSLPLTEIKNK